jgi:hypothetical protein
LPFITARLSIRITAEAIKENAMRWFCANKRTRSDGDDDEDDDEFEWASDKNHQTPVIQISKIYISQY